MPRPHLTPEKLHPVGNSTKMASKAGQTKEFQMFLQVIIKILFLFATITFVITYNNNGALFLKIHFLVLKYFTSFSTSLKIYEAFEG